MIDTIHVNGDLDETATLNIRNNLRPVIFLHPTHNFMTVTSYCIPEKL